MAKLSDLVSRTAEVTGVPVATVREISRRLRERDLIETGIGGRYGGAEMTVAHAATLLTALLIARASSDSLSDIVSLTQAHLTTFRAYYPRPDRLLLGDWDRRLGLTELCKLKQGHTFGEAFTGLLSSIANGDFKRAIGGWASKRPRGERPFFGALLAITSPRPHRRASLEFETPAFGRLELFYLRPADARKLVAPEAPLKWSDVVDSAYYDLRVRASLSQQSLVPLGLLLQKAGAVHE
jgi:hypothetical protein